jgi:3-hydroxymyristoyl/3-hydroxydecanoyl-(acyl carrier protein) dehydratase
MRFLFVDRICELDRGTRVRAVKNISWYGDFLEEIFPGLPVFSPVIAAEAAAQALSWLIVEAKDFSVKPLITVLDSYTCSRHVQPGDRIEMEGQVESFQPESALAHARILLNKRPAAEINHGVCYLYPLAELQDPESARRQFQNLTENKVPLPAAAQIPAGLPPGTGTATAARPWVDRVIEYEAGKKIVGIRNVTGTEDYFNDHFPRRPILPGVIIMAGLTSVAQLLLGPLLAASGIDHKKAVLRQAKKIKFRKLVQPGDQLLLEAVLLSFNPQESSIRARALIGDTVAATLSADFLHLSREEYITAYLA